MHQSNRSIVQGTSNIAFFGLNGFFSLQCTDRFNNQFGFSNTEWNSFFILLWGTTSIYFTNFDLERYI